MSLYYEAAAALTAPASDGGNLKTRIFGPRSKDAKDGKDKDSTSKKDKPGKPASTVPPAQIYALAAESCKWSAVLSEVIDGAELLVHERRHRLTPTLALLLVHDLLIAKGGNGGVQLPANHGLRAAVERHKARLSSELARARVRRRATTLPELREMVEKEAVAAVSSSSLAAATRWVRINTLKTTLEEQLATTFAGYERVSSVRRLFSATDEAEEAKEKEEKAAAQSKNGTLRIYIDEHVSNLVAVPLVTAPSSSSTIDLTRCEAYKQGAIIFQDKASCFPAYLLDPDALATDGDDGDGDEGGGHIIDACAAPGNKTSHLAALLKESWLSSSSSSSSRACPRRVFAFEKDNYRAKTLQNMLAKAGALDLVTVDAGQDFLKVDPTADRFRNVRALLLDPSCSGSGIVGRDAMPTLHLPKAPPEPKSKGPSASSQAPQPKGKKRKRGAESKDKKTAAAEKEAAETTDADEAGEAGDGETDPAARLAALASFQLTLLLHAFSFPAARRVTYSTCSIHAQENEQVVIKALKAAAQSEKINGNGPSPGRWRLLRRDEQVEGMRAWPVRGDPACAKVEDGEDDSDDDDDDSYKLDAAAAADACIRSYPDDDRGVMGFFVAAFVRDDRSDLTRVATRANGAAATATDTPLGPQRSQPKKKKNKGKKKSKSAAAVTKDDKPQADDDDDDWGGFDD